MNIPTELYYTKDHEWVKIDGNIATIGITDFAQSELGDIVYVEIETIGQSLAQEAIFGTVEAVKTVSDLFLPMAGKVLDCNPLLVQNPEKVNEDPYGDGWMIHLEIENPNAISSLLDAAAYSQLIGV